MRATDCFRVVFETPTGETTVWIRSDEHILDAARRAGLPLPSLCEQGWCTTCAVRIIEGEVDQSDALRYYAQDREAGFALICTAKPRSDLRLRTHAAAALREHRRRTGLPAPRAAGI